MSQFDAFSEFGMLDFSGADSPAKTAYDALVAQYSAAFDLTPGTYAEAKIFAMAMAIGRLRTTVARTDAQRSPSTVLEKLPAMELDYGVTPGPTDTIQQRQAVLVARKLLMRGSRQEAIETDLRAALGPDFVALRVNASPLTANVPSAFPDPNHPPKFYTLTDPIAFINVSSTVHYSPLNSSEYLKVGDIVCVEQEIDGIGEHVRVTASATAPGSRTFSAIFLNPHTAGASLCTHGIRYESTRREVDVVVRVGVIGDLNKMGRVNEIMARHSRSVTRWGILETPDSVTVGPFIVGTSHVGSVPIGPAAVTI